MDPPLNSSPSSCADNSGIKLQLGRARGLPVKNLLDRSSDPYCVFTLPAPEECPATGTQLKEFSYQSRVCNRTLEPQWYEEVKLPASQGKQLLQVDVHDQKFWTAKLPGVDGFHHMCSLAVALKEITYSPTWFALRDRAGKPAGELELHRVGEGAVSQRVHEYKKFYSKAANVLQGKLASAYIVHQVELYDVDAVFEGVRQGWNREYRAAQMIFGDTREALAVRAAVYSQHAWLYNNIPTPETGSILDGAQLMELFGFGQRNGKVRAYTYVIVECQTAGRRQFVFRFSETGIKLAKDYLSKHAMHANAATEVIYAGEFHVVDEGGEKILMMDNCSGTYAPDKALLPKLCTLFESSFAGLKVRAVDSESEELLGTVSRINPCRETTAPLPQSLKDAPPETLPDSL